MSKMKSSRCVYRVIVSVSLVFALMILPISTGLIGMENTVVAAPSDPFYQKWVEWGCPGGGMGFVIGDLYHTGIDDIVKAGNNWTIAIKGTDATLTNEQRIRWTASTPGVVNTTQPQMADLDGDSYLEIIVPMQVSPAGFYILSHNGTVIDKIVPNIWGGQSDNGPVIADIDGDGIPTI
ncbi:VCBS repeat-containing protein, partial [Candidatus Bathyarchaeota archaeon]|nr:VCBS repeat-containing protein [Candidatus Bathyarchaeota archaeon]